MIQQTNISIQWQLYDPLDRKYFWIDVVSPVIPLNTSSAERKLKARELARQAIELARSQCHGLDVRAIRVRKEIKVMRDGSMKEGYIFFKLHEQLTLNK